LSKRLLTQIGGILTRTPKFRDPYDGDATIRYDMHCVCNVQSDTDG